MYSCIDIGASVIKAVCFGEHVQNGADDQAQLNTYINSALFPLFILDKLTFHRVKTAVSNVFI